jgi:hypothetical protein
MKIDSTLMIKLLLKPKPTKADSLLKLSYTKQTLRLVQISQLCNIALIIAWAAFFLMDSFDESKGETT